MRPPLLHPAILVATGDQVWKDAAEGECYLADGSGSKIEGNDFSVSLRDGNVMSLLWTLCNYMKLSGAAHPSWLRLYCVHTRFLHVGRCVKVYHFFSYIVISYLEDNGSPTVVVSGCYCSTYVPRFCFDGMCCHQWLSWQSHILLAEEWNSTGRRNITLAHCRC